MTQFSSMGKYMPEHFDGDGCVFPITGHFAPRNKSNPTNKILVDLRRYREHWATLGGTKDWAYMLQLFNIYPGVWGATPEEEVHAHKVISRLARLEES